VVLLRDLVGRQHRDDAGQRQRLAVVDAAHAACGIGLARSFVKSIPSARKSSAYFARPVIFATRSCGAKLFPISL
jgi:hypothetical protein